MTWRSPNARGALPAVMALIAVALTACGGSGSSTTGATPVASVRATSQHKAVASTATPVKAPLHRSVVSRHVVRHRVPPGAGDIEPSNPTPHNVNTSENASSAYIDPCDLVSAAQAEAILGTRVAAQEAPLGPTCIYQSKGSRNFVTLSLQRVNFAQLKAHIRHLTKLEIDGRTGYCGLYGQLAVFVPITHERVLTIAASCGLGGQFAAKALTRGHR